EKPALPGRTAGETHGWRSSRHDEGHLPRGRWGRAHPVDGGRHHPRAVARLMTTVYFVATDVERRVLWSGQIEHVPHVDHFVTLDNAVYMVTALNWLLSAPGQLPDLEVELARQQ